tara:strand:+ start:1032 stop:1220 length:189 start_codon:yes stop_codon:yes gene_type:complete
VYIISIPTKGKLTMKNQLIKSIQEWQKENHKNGSVECYSELNNLSLEELKAVSAYYNLKVAK